MIRRYIIWRNNHAYDERLRRVIARANVPDAALEGGRAQRCSTSLQDTIPGAPCSC